MKSRVAKEYLINNLEIIKGCDKLFVSPATAIKAIEMAESEMKAKAAQAHQKNCTRYIPTSGKCRNGFKVEKCTPDTCQYMQFFINWMEE